MRTGNRNTRSTDIRRTAGGALDAAYYEREARKLRARTIRLVLRRTRRWAVMWLRAIGTRMKARAARRELLEWDARALRDIGLSHGDLPAVASGEFVRDSSRRQRQRRAT